MGIVILFGFITLLLCLPPYNVHPELQLLTTNKQYHERQTEPTEILKNRSSRQ